MDRTPFEVGSLFGDLLGWCLALLLAVFVLVGPLRRDERAAQAYLLAVILHVAAAAIYVYVPDVLPIRRDSHVFHRYAALEHGLAESSFGIGSHFFEEYLAKVYSLASPSFFLGSILSIYAFALSVIVLTRFMELLEVHRGKGLVILLFGALPTSVLYGSVPMREPYQVLFFMLACYSMLRFRLSGQPLHLLIAIMFALIMGLLHKGLILYAPFLIIMMLLVHVDHSDSRSTGRIHLHRLAAVALAIGFVVWIFGAGHKLQEFGGTEVLVSATIGEGLVEFATERRDEEALSRGRTAYGVALNTSSPVQFVKSTVMIILYYMFTPFPWQIRNFLDLYAFGEVLLRIACLVAIFRIWRRVGPVRPQIVTLLMVVYFSMAFLWAAGTTNYGTATRHHMIHQWIILLLGVPALVRMRWGFADGRPTAQRPEPPRFSRSRGTPRIPPLRSLVDRFSPPPRLGAARRSTRGLRAAKATPRVFAARAPGRPRRLTKE